ncbi:MAG: hypothetical protein KGJ62_08440 [Armatimonadetes bacterium]|nr:hypothetical protein [Armatimonadota bacterium]MDE2205080.1 hypothetical protein [Armatimonadota bacterium]
MSNDGSETNDKTRAAESTAQNPPATAAAPPKLSTPVQGVDILKLLSELEELFTHVRHMPGRILVGLDEERVALLIMKIRANLPESVKRGSAILQESELTRNRAIEEADKIRDRAGTVAREAMEHAQHEAKTLRVDADEYAATVRLDAERDAEKLRTDAHAESTAILSAARERAEFLVSESEVMAEAVDEANRMIANARAESDAMRQGADDYSMRLLMEVEAGVAHALERVQRARQALEPEAAAPTE